VRANNSVKNVPLGGEKKRGGGEKEKNRNSYEGCPAAERVKKRGGQSPRVRGLGDFFIIDEKRNKAKTMNGFQGGGKT